MQEKVYSDVAANLDQGHVAAWRALITANALVLEKIERAPAGASPPPPGWAAGGRAAWGAPRGAGARPWRPPPGPGRRVRGGVGAIWGSGWAVAHARARPRGGFEPQRPY